MNTFKLIFISLVLGSSSGQYMTRPVYNGFNSQPVLTHMNSGLSGLEMPASGSFGNKLVVAQAARPQIQQFFSAPMAPAAQQTTFLPAAAPCSRPHVDDSNQQQEAPSNNQQIQQGPAQQLQSYGAAPAADSAPVAQITLAAHQNSYADQGAAVAPIAQQQASYSAAPAPTPLQMFATQAASVPLAAVEPAQNLYASQAAPVQQFLSAAPAPVAQQTSDYSAPAAQIAPIAHQSSDYSAPAAQIAPIAQQSVYSAPAAQIAPIAHQSSDYSAPSAQIAPIAQQSGYSAPSAQIAPVAQQTSDYSTPAAQVSAIVQQSTNLGYASTSAQNIQSAEQTFGVQPAQQSFSGQTTFSQQNSASQHIAPADSSAQLNHFQSASAEHTLQAAAPCANNGPSAADVNVAVHQIQTSLPQQFQSVSQQTYAAPVALAPVAPVAQAAVLQQHATYSAPAQRPYVSFSVPTGASGVAPPATASY